MCQKLCVLYCGGVCVAVHVFYRVICVCAPARQRGPCCGSVGVDCRVCQAAQAPGARARVSRSRREGVSSDIYRIIMCDKDVSYVTAHAGW